MRKLPLLLIKTSFVLAVAILATAPAIGNAVEMPKELRGQWCYRHNSVALVRCRELNRPEFAGGSNS